ncbi:MULTISPECIES: helix-turn-helix transcriptional regulator [Vagococcus]|uniref:Transcriptional regulator n=2 Tax=Vagococcus TaxID=2737 RepID=A0A430A919_9ENTE|nr:helix-turn-helix transcriptional regulator [Vagococcus proximus]RSU03559.1 transcriptional regulator [Vagococcus fessus]
MKVLRAERNWTQQDLAKKLGVTRQTISSIEKGKYSLSLKLAFEISEIFEVELLDVFNNEGSEKNE